MQRPFPAQQVRAAAEQTLQQHGYRPPYQYINEAQVLIGEEPGNFAYCLQYQLHTTKHKERYVVLVVDADSATNELEASILYKRANMSFTSSELQYSLYR